MTSQEARAELGVSQSLIAQLLESNLLPRVEARAGIRGYSRIRWKDLRELQQRIFKNVGVGNTDGRMLPIASVCRATAQDTTDILGALIDGRLERVRAAPGHDYQISKLRFDRDEVLQHFMKVRQVPRKVSSSKVLGQCDFRDSKVLKQRDAAKYLRVKTATVPYLMTLGLLEAEVVPNSFNGRPQSVVSIAVLDAFKEEFIPVSETAKQYETHTNVILDALRNKGIKPIYDGCGGGVSRFFRRCELENVLLIIPRRDKKKRKTARPA